MDASAVWQSRYVWCCCVTQQTCLLYATADIFAVWHSRGICCVTQQTCLLCDPADISVMLHSRHVCCVTEPLSPETRHKTVILCRRMEGASLASLLTCDTKPWYNTYKIFSTGTYALCCWGGGGLPLLRYKTTVLHRWRGRGMSHPLLRCETFVLCRK